MVDTSVIDSTIFTIVDFTSNTKTLAIYSENVAHAGFYDFLVTVYYDR